MGRAPCCEKNGLKKGPWTPEEDQKLIDYIKKNGYGNWRTLPKNAGLQRCGKSCRLRWTNYLRPDIKRGRFSFEEEETIIQLHSILGNKWSAIAARLPGRTDNEIKNYWNTHIRKRLLRMGIDPVTHSPRLDLLDLSSILSSSLYNTSQMNLSRLLGVQPLVNPEILRLASSLFSNSHHHHQQENTNFILQNVQENHLCNNPQMVQNQFQHNNQVQEIPSSSGFANEAQIMEPNAEHFSSNMANFNSQVCELNQWQGNLGGEDHYLPVESYNYYGGGSDQNIMDFPVYDNVDESNNFVSALSSTPSSSVTPLDSNSTYVSTEDEKESYCSTNLMKFEIPDLFDVSDYM